MPRSFATLALLLGLAACDRDPGVGAPCLDAARDCALTARTACILAWPGGYCTEIDCQLGSCPSGARCVTGISFPNVPLDAFCLATCELPTDCRPGYRCGTVGTTADKVCAPSP